METIVKYAQELVYNLVCLMPSVYQKASLNALFGLFLEAQGHALPQHTQVKSAPSLSRFLNHYHWSTRSVIRTTRQAVLQQIAQHPAHPSTPLRVLIDVTSLEKCGKFLQLSTPTDNPEAPDPWVRMRWWQTRIALGGVVSGDRRVASALELSGMAGQGLSNSCTTGVQVVGNGSNPIEPKQGGGCASRYGIWHHRVSQGGTAAMLASGGRNALQS